VSQFQSKTGKEKIISRAGRPEILEDGLYVEGPFDIPAEFVFIDV
jgi:hypothetical protein